MHIVMNMSNYEIESNSAQKEIADSMCYADRNPVNVHLSLAEQFSSKGKLKTLPANIAVTNPDSFVHRMVNYRKVTE
jgi:hypothetical protein